MGWPLGSVVAQGCHAATAALWESKDTANTQQYCSAENIGQMHKVVLEVKGEAQLHSLADGLREAGVPHRLWLELPEKHMTCLATAPSSKASIQAHFKKLKLCSL